MYARLTFGKALPEQFDRIRKIYNEEIIPPVLKQKGCINIFMLEPVDKSEDFISQTLWQTKADADAYEASGLYKQLVGKLTNLLAKEPVLKTYTYEQVVEKAPVVH